MPVEVIFPKVDMDMKSGELAEWLCKHGDRVEKGVPIFVIETDKAGMEIESPGTGIIAIAGDFTGEQVPVGDVVAYIYTDGEEIPEQQDPQSAEVLRQINSSPTEEPAVSTREQSTPVAEESNPALHLDSHIDAPSHIRASPAARRYARENNVSLESITGSARRGRIVREDVVEFISGGRQTNISAIATSVGSGEQSPSVSVPHSRIRKIIATRLVEASRDIPDYQIAVECNCTSLLLLKSELDKAVDLTASAVKVSINDLFVRALGLTLRDHPDANCSWSEEARIIHGTVDIGIAVALEDGLITPIVKDTANKTVLQIAMETKALIKKAKSGLLKSDEFKGGSSTVSNLGMYDIVEFTSIVNPPQASIVSIASVSMRPVVDSNGELGVAPLCKVSFSFDHRLIDGAAGAKVANSFKGYVENAFVLML